MRTLFKTFFACLMSLALLSPVLAQDDTDAIGKLTPEQEKSLQEILAKPIDEKAMYSTQSTQYKEKVRASLLLGQMAQQEALLKAWSRIDPDGLWNLRSFYSSMGRYDEAISVAQGIIDSTKFPPSLARMNAYMAMDFMAINEIDKAKIAFDKAEDWIKQGNGPFTRAAPGWSTRAQTEFFTLKSNYLLRIGKKDEAMAVAKLAVERAKNLLGTIDSFDSELFKTLAKATATRATGNLVTQQVSNGQYIDAQWTMRDALKRAKDSGFNQNHMYLFYLMSSDITAGTGQFEASLGYANKAEKIHLDQGYPKASANWLHAQSKKLRALVGLERWKDAKAVLADVEVAIKDSVFSLDGNLDADLVAMVELQNGQEATALARLQRNLDKQTKVFGEHHFNTGQTAGLLAVAQFKNQQASAARQRFVQAHKILTNPESLTGDGQASAIQQSVIRYVFDGHMKLLAQSAKDNPQDAVALFELADLANNSSVQTALTEAAVRMSINVPGLSEVVRQDQDAKQETASLITYINNQNSVPAEQRNPKVVEQMRQRLHAIEDLRKSYKAQIQKQYPDYFRLLQPRAPKPEQIARLLAPDEVFVSIQPMRDESYVWSIDAQGKVNFHITPWGEQQTRAAVERIRRTLDVAEFGNRAPKFDEATSHEIYSAFFAPQAPALQGKKHLVVATSGALAKLPFAVLVTQRSAAGARLADTEWLIRQTAISHVPSASGWASLKKLASAQHGSEALAAWGDPQFDVALNTAAAAPGSVVRSLPTRSVMGGNLEASQSEAYLTYSKMPPLPETRDEVLAIADILGANPKSDVILGKAASRSSVLKHSASGHLAKKQVVVFATHGLLAGDLPNLSQPALAMAATADPKESPLLTLEDVLSLKLNADWVVLSACNTAGADGKAEEAMSGLARGFFYAGSRSLLVTHWSVESESAKQLTTRTFTAYKNDQQLRRAEALRLAMLETMKTPAYAHPAFWAPYALVGEGGR